jgi:hypothetical protein
MPLRDENRLIVNIGLALLQQTQKPGLIALMDVAAGQSCTASADSQSAQSRTERPKYVKKRKVTSSFISFTIAPRINAIGRISSAARAVELFLTDSLEYANRLANELCDANRERQETENRIAAEALMPETAFKGISKECISRFGAVNSLCIDRIAGRFGVSTISALRRMHETKVINRETFFNLLGVITEEYHANIARIEASRKGKDIRLPYHIRYLNQNGFLLPRTVLIAHASGKITHGEMCKALNINSKHIGSMEQAVMFK